MFDNDELFYTRAWCFVKGAFDAALPAMRKGSWKSEDCAAEIERILLDAENFANEEETL